MKKNNGHFIKGTEPWNKGLTKEVDSRISVNTKYSHMVAPFTKNCPICNSNMKFSTKYTLLTSLDRNSSCQKCANVGKGWQTTHTGYDRTDEINQKSRVSAINRIKNTKGQISPNYNKLSIPILEAKAKELGITDLQHAENGGEFQVCGYFVDGYSKEHNIVFEYDEKHHFKNGNLKEKDIKRQSQIEKTLDCKFIRIAQETL
tara:strand:+ start:527 stop:1135 length:609 start_codon:yes stop_codon:yes gene_type:complete